MCKHGEAAISASVELYEQLNQLMQFERQVKDNLLDVVETTSKCVVSNIDKVEDCFIQPGSGDSEDFTRYKSRKEKIAYDQLLAQLLDDHFADEEEHREAVSAPAAVSMVPLSREQGLHGKVVASAQADTFRPLQRFAAQESLILETLKLAGYDPKALPKPSSGKAGVKAQVKRFLEKEAVFAGATVFDKAWERLRAQKSIAEKQFPSLEQEARPYVPTAQAAHYLMVTPQTLREWACYGRHAAELRPVRIGGRLAWPMEGIRAMLGLS